MTLLRTHLFPICGLIAAGRRNRIKHPSELRVFWETEQRFRIRSRCRSRNWSWSKFALKNLK